MRKFLLFTMGLLLNLSALSAESEKIQYPIANADYPKVVGAWESLVSRVEFAPFNLFVTIIFFCAIIHTFCYGKFLNLSKRFEEKSLLETGKKQSKKHAIFFAELFHLLGEVEAIFALWLVPLFLGFGLVYGWNDLTAYLDKLTFVDAKYVEPVFVIVVMCVASTRPLIQLSGDIINLFARLGKGKIWAWWVSILIVGPLLGSFITEPASITICATLLVKKFYSFNPSMKFRYATLGLLLVAISVGGTLTHFSAPPVLMVATAWDWGMPFMLANFGWKAILAVIISVSIYGIFFRKEFAKMQLVANEKLGQSGEDNRVEWKIVLVHVGFLIFIVHSLHHPALFIFAFLLFLAFVNATRQHQYDVNIKMPLLVGLFLASLVTHGSLQSWWIEPILGNFGEAQTYIGSMILSAFNDNALITYLATLAPEFTPQMKYLIVAGAVSAGGLTIIANAPNPAGVAILKKHFGTQLSPLKLFYGSILPTVIVAIIFFFL
ncbi:MAG: putative Na+/H+ antiporter [Opitutales bacterium]|nr:putative Na+/H+ antiporter [Opitutales bacterium]